MLGYLRRTLRKLEGRDAAAEPYPEVYLAALQSRDFLGEVGASIGAHMTYLTLVLRTDPSHIEILITFE